MEIFKLEINFGNEAILDAEDVARALEKIARRLRNGDKFGIIHDDNGNKCGQWSL